MKKMLVHVCCADCAVRLTSALGKELGITPAEMVLYFYNPNIHPETEWQARVAAVKEAFADKKYSLVFTNWTPKDYFSRVRRLTQKISLVPSPAERCPLCWEMRLAKAFDYAMSKEILMVTSTLFTSIYHDQKKLRGIASSLANKNKLKVYFPDQVDHEMKTGGFYKQNYCGCIFSLMETFERKYITNKEEVSHCC